MVFKKSKKKLLLLGITLILVMIELKFAPVTRMVLIGDYTPTFTALDETTQNYNRLFDEPVGEGISSSNGPSLQETFDEFTEISTVLKEYEDELTNDRTYDIFLRNHSNMRTYSCSNDCEREEGDGEKSHQEIWGEYLNKLAPLHDRIRSFAELQGPVFQVDLIQDGAQTPHPLAISRFVRSLSLETEHLAKQGDMNGVVQNIVSIWKLSDQLAEEPFLISQLIRSKSQQTAMNLIQDHCALSSFSSEQSQELIDLLGASDSTEAFANSFLLDIENFLSLLEEVRNKDSEENSDYEGLFYLNGNFTAADILTFFIGSPFQEPFLVREESIYLKFLSPLPAMARQPYHEIDDALETMFKEYENKRSLEFGALIQVPHTVRILTYRAQYNAQLRLARIGLAIEQYKREHGVFPVSLKEVESILGEPVPIDPFSGESFKYYPGMDNFLLYSVGYDKVDDSGEFYDSHRGFTSPLEKKDIVWRESGKEINSRAEYEASKKKREPNTQPRTPSEGQE